MVKIILDINLVSFQFIMNQNVYQISCMCQHKLARREEVFRFQRIYAKHFNVKNQIKSMFAYICNTYCIIQSKFAKAYYSAVQNNQRFQTIVYQSIHLPKNPFVFRVPLVPGKYEQND